MAAREMVIGKFINQIGFRIDHSTVQQVKNTVESVKSGIKTVQGVADEVKKRVNDNIDEIQKKAQKARSETEKLPEFKPGQKSTQNAKSAIDEIKDYAKKTLGVLGIGFSLTQLRSLAEEFGSINDAIRGATRELGDQSEIQQKILKGAQDCREEYGAMAGSVTKLIQQNGKLFPVDDAVKFVSLVEKLEKGAGREANIDSTMDVLTEAMSSGKLDKTGFANLKSKAPEVVNAISSAVGVSEAQLQKLAESGKLSAKQLKDAFFASESEIQKNFDELGFDITDALKYVRNEWGLLIADLDDTFGITTRIGKAIRDGSDFLIGKAQKFTSWLKSVSDKLGGVEQLLKLIALAAAALFLATNGNMVLSFLSGAVKLLKGFNVQTALAAAKWLLLFLVLEDVFTFLQGGDSVLGRFLSDAGVDVDALRDKISNFFSNAKQFGKDALGDLNNSMGRELGKPNESTGRALRCQFSCEVGDSSSSNTGKITLWNLADETLRLLEQEDCLIELSAGYKDDLPTIMGGTLTYFETEQSGADQQTTIEFVDSFTSCRDNTVSLSYSGTVSGDKIVRDAAQIMGCEVKFSKSAKLIDFTNFAFVGAGKTLIERVCNRSKMRWSLQNGIVQICALDEPITMAAYVLSASTGLIGSPKPVFESASTSDKKSSNASKRKAKKGIEVTYALNGHIQVDDYVKVDSKPYKGNYRASKIKFTGDTEGDDWKCVALFVEVK